jgi:hypothetical protein
MGAYIRGRFPFCSDGRGKSDEGEGGQQREEEGMTHGKLLKRGGLQWENVVKMPPVSADHSMKHERSRRRSSVLVPRFGNEVAARSRGSPLTLIPFSACDLT